METLSGTTIPEEKLKDAVRLVNRKRRVLQRINEFRKLENPPISGTDALLVSQISLNHDINKFIAAGENLVRELTERAKNGVSAYQTAGPRVMIAGTPSPMGYAKVHHIVESCGMQVVVDESCTGERYYRDPVDESVTGMEALIEAIAARYFKIDCPCFSPNRERVDNILAAVKEYKVQGVVQSILMYCHGFNIEAKVVENALDEVKAPSLKIVTDYSDEDKEQIRVRVEAFRDILGS
jgi:benzoyl-CoA reductase/2-hydroxyglutaryl-CoA dehydratase subunit BcrC/BadD/HgdB